MKYDTCGQIITSLNKEKQTERKSIIQLHIK